MNGILPCYGSERLRHRRAVIEKPYDAQKHTNLSLISKGISFLRYAESLERIPNELRDAKKIQAAFEIADQHNWTAEELEVYDYWALREGGHMDALETAGSEGPAEGRSEGLAEGRKDGLETAAKEMLARGMDVGLIAAVTGLHEDEIRRLS